MTYRRPRLRHDDDEVRIEQVRDFRPKGPLYKTPVDLENLPLFFERARSRFSSSIRIMRMRAASCLLCYTWPVPSSRGT
ncbi:MAG: hypothetical protein KatS3mg077_3015 [Candidatus Binatia bacterium]|nr:MAG: hypothetical protein KatS3mg077_3015 [Candidatus Binatia bacterium]